MRHKIMQKHKDNKNNSYVLSTYHTSGSLLYVYDDVYLCMRVCMCVCVCVYTHAHTYTNTHHHTHTVCIYICNLNHPPPKINHEEATML